MPGRERERERVCVCSARARGAPLVHSPNERKKSVCVCVCVCVVVRVASLRKPRNCWAALWAGEPRTLPRPEGRRRRERERERERGRGRGRGRGRARGRPPGQGFACGPYTTSKQASKQARDKNLLIIFVFLDHPSPKTVRFSHLRSTTGK